jgi:cysteine desulfurase
MQVYLDNAATTQLSTEVIAEMTHFMHTFYGNPSSTHSKGREARVEVEKARKKISQLVGTIEKEIIFTSGGTEANNTILKSLVLSKRVARIISSPIEHHSVLDSLDWIKNNTDTEVTYLNVDSYGNVDVNQLEMLLQDEISTLVSLMHANNEIGNLLDLTRVGNICNKHNALFHSDMVQSLGHYPTNLNELPLDFATASAHKNHGPKGVGFLYINSKNDKLNTFLHGGSQERGIRGGTENIIGIIGMAKAYERSVGSLEKDKNHILKLKMSMIEGIEKNFSNISFNGRCTNIESSLYNLLNLKIQQPIDETLLFNLDINGIYVSEGSACSSGAAKGSHVLNKISDSNDSTNNLRISFSKNNTEEEIDYTLKTLADLIAPD